MTLKVGICKERKDPKVDIDTLYQKGRSLPAVHIMRIQNVLLSLESMLLTDRDEQKHKGGGDVMHWCDLNINPSVY